MLAVARALKSAPPIDDLPAGLVFIANVGEEGEGNLSGMRYICRQSPLARRIAAFLVLDGASTEHITSTALGSRRFELTFSGPGGHSWSDYGTGNPVHALSRAVSLFSDTKLNGSPRAAFNIGVIEGGASINSIPTLAKAKIDIRSESNQKMDDLVAALSAAVERAQNVENERATGGKVTAKLKEIGSRPAGKLAEGRVDPHLRPRRRRASRHSLPSRLRLDRRQHSALARYPGRLDRSRRPGRQGAYAERVVSAGRPRPGAEAHPAHPDAAAS